MAIDFAGIEVLSFDCYGTLIDWESGLLPPLRALLAAHGQSSGDESLLEQYAALEAEAETGEYRSYRDVLQTVADGFGRQGGFALTPAERGSLAASLPEWMPFPDTVAALQALETRFRLVIISNIDDDLFAATSRCLSVRFDQVVTAQQARAYKPSPRPFLLARERLPVPPSRWLHVAQSLYHDVAPARELGLSTFWVNRRAGRAGFGATPAARVRPDHEVPDLATLAASALTQ